MRRPTEELIDAIAWLPVSKLSQITLFPTIADSLQAAYQAGFTAHFRYLGTAWVD